MDILSRQCGFINDNFSNTKINNEIQKNSSFKENSEDLQIFRLNPLLNDSLNNLVKRFEKTKIPKLPPTKGLSIRKKSKLSNSLPNLFLPTCFDDNKYCNSEKKVTWTNKLDLNLERLKHVFRDSYTYWCQQKRSQSIPIFNRNYSDEYSKKDSTNLNITNEFQQNFDVSESVHVPMDHLFNISSLQSLKDTNLGKDCKINHLEVKQSYSTHVYLDGAIIEPISPASQTCSTVATANIVDSYNTEVANIETPKIIPRKKGRPRKIQNIVITQESLLRNEINKSMNDKTVKAVLPKKQKKLNKQNQSTSFHTEDVQVHNIFNPINISNSILSDTETTPKKLKDTKANSSKKQKNTAKLTDVSRIDDASVEHKDLGKSTPKKLKDTNVNQRFIKTNSLKKQNNNEKQMEGSRMDDEHKDSKKKKSLEKSFDVSIINNDKVEFKDSDENTIANVDQSNLSRRKKSFEKSDDVSRTDDESVYLKDLGESISKKLKDTNLDQRIIKGNSQKKQKNKDKSIEANRTDDESVEHKNLGENKLRKKKDTNADQRRIKVNSSRKQKCFEKQTDISKTEDESIDFKDLGENKPKALKDTDVDQILIKGNSQRKHKNLAETNRIDDTFVELKDSRMKKSLKKSTDASQMDDKNLTKKIKDTNVDQILIKTNSSRNQKDNEKPNDVSRTDHESVELKNAEENNSTLKEDETCDKDPILKQNKLIRPDRPISDQVSEFPIERISKSYGIKDICGKDVGTKNSSPIKKQKLFSLEMKVIPQTSEKDILKSYDKNVKRDEKPERSSTIKKQKNIPKLIKSSAENKLYYKFDLDASPVIDNITDIYQESIEETMCKNFDTVTDEQNLQIKLLSRNTDEKHLHLNTTQDNFDKESVDEEQRKGSRKRKTTKLKNDTKFFTETLKKTVDPKENDNLVLQGIDISPTEEIFLNVDSCMSLQVPNTDKSPNDDGTVENIIETVNDDEKVVQDKDEVAKESEVDLKDIREFMTDHEENVKDIVKFAEEIDNNSDISSKVLSKKVKYAEEIIKYDKETDSDVVISAQNVKTFVNDGDSVENIGDAGVAIEKYSVKESPIDDISESHKKSSKPQVSYKSKKQPISLISKDCQPHLKNVIANSEESNLPPNLSKRVKIKHRFFDEFEMIDSKTVSIEEDKVDVNAVKLFAKAREVIEYSESYNYVDIADDSIKDNIRKTIDQSNDIEVLSKSLADSVDTSMLPPRKRYKRMMYLDQSKSASSKDTSITDDVKAIDILDSGSQDVEEVQTKKVTNCNSRFKRKKHREHPAIVNTEIPENVFDFDNSISAEEINDEESSVHSKILSHSNEPIGATDIPSCLKRSKREAAARGFTNEVAMSLTNNNNSQSHESSSDLTIKATFSKVEVLEEVLTDASTAKPLKRSRKTNANISSNTKNKEEVNATKVSFKKQRISREKSNDTLIKENPPSPGDTIISKGSSSQDIMKYRKIRTNIYIDHKPSHWNQEVEKCGCKRSDQKNLFDAPDKKIMYGVKKSSNIVWDCGDNCLNRLTYTECNPKTCQCGDVCNNQKIRKLDWATHVKITDIQSKGRGVITTKAIKAGTLITEYVGEVISETTFQERMINLYREDAHHYCLHLDGEMLIDAYRIGSLARFVNHSCQPNCEMQKWMVNGAYRMCLFANEDINSDTEITYDYNFCSFNTKTTQICLCGASNCRGFIGGRPRAEQSESQKDRKKLFYVFGRILPIREKLFVRRRAIFLIRSRVLGRCKKLGIRRSKQTHGNKLPSAITEIKRRKAKKNQFLTQMSALNSIRSIRTRLLQNAQNNENLTRTAQLGQVLRDLYNTLLEQKDPLNPIQQLVAPFINCLKQKKYPEFYYTLGQDSVVCLSQVYSRLLDGKYATMMSFDQDILQMLQHIELYAGKQSNIGKCAERIKPLYKDLKMNTIALYEALTDEMMDDRDKNKLLSNNLTQITNAVKSLSNNIEVDLSDSTSQSKNKRRKQGSLSSVAGNRGRLERGAEVIKCVCGFLIEAGHVMVQCDRCFVWQHSYCMNVARSSELVDVTRMEPYFCHVCLNISSELLVREIPRHFVITDETVDGVNTLFWTLLHPDLSLLKIDDFVYIKLEDEKNPMSLKPKVKIGSPQPLDLSRLTIMRIYSLWKDSNGQRWMEGGLFLRPYTTYIKTTSGEKTIKKSDSVNKRKSNLDIDLSSHKWHHQEVVYTELTKILPLDVCVGRCHVLNNHTFRLGKPLSQSNNVNINEHTYVCDWLINKNGEWSELDPSYLKINTKPYCFKRHIDSSSNNESSNDKFQRQYIAEELLQLDQGISEDSSINKGIKSKYGFNHDEKKISRLHSFEKLVTKLSEFAYERTRKLPLSPSSSLGSRSNPSSRGSSPQCENAGSKSPSKLHENYYQHCSRKQLLPKKTIIDTSLLPQVANKTPNAVTSEYFENSPKLMIVCEDDRSTKEPPQKVLDTISSNVDKYSDVLSNSLVENLYDKSNSCSKIKYGDLLNLLKETISLPTLTKTKKGKRKPALKKNILKPVSEINAADENWLPSCKSIQSIAPRRETRSRRSLNDEKAGPNNSNEVIDYQEESNGDDDEEDKESKLCFIQLERVRVNRAEKNKQKKAIMGKSVGSVESIVPTTVIDEALTSKNLNTEDSTPKQTTCNNDCDINQSQSEKTFSTITSNNRSKRKKGVPKRIPFDFSYQQTLETNVNPTEHTLDVLGKFDAVDLSAIKSIQIDKLDQPNTSFFQKTELVEMASLTIVSTKTSKVNVVVANDFSSIENISSN